MQPFYLRTYYHVCTAVVILSLLTYILRAERQSARMSIITNDWLNPDWHNADDDKYFFILLYSGTHMATEGVKGLK